MLKKFILIFIWATIFVTSNLAQSEDSQTDRRNGVRAGYHLASMVTDGSKPDTAKNLSSFYVGFVREQPLKGIFYYGGGLEYFQNGQKFNNDRKRVIHYLSIPAHLKVKIGPAFALGGITANFKMAEKIHNKGDKESPSKDNKANWFDSAAFAGAGIKIAFVTIEARYHWGLVNAGRGLHNRYFQLGAGVMF